MLSQKQQQSLNSAAAAAVKSEKETGVPALLTVSQWALESFWGQDAPGNNPFGIKAKEGQHLETTEVVHGEAVKEVQTFEVFPTLDDAFARHGQLLATDPRYQSAIAAYSKTKSAASLFNEIGKTYATDPHYALKLYSIALMSEVRYAISLAMKKAVILTIV